MIGESAATRTRQGPDCSLSNIRGVRHSVRRRMKKVKSQSKTFDELLEQKTRFMRIYVLDENLVPVPLTDGEWIVWLMENNRDAGENVARTTIGTVEVVTSFLGMDINLSFRGHPNPKPHVFETIIFDSKHGDSVMARYSTWKEAEEGHAAIVTALNASSLSSSS